MKSVDPLATINDDDSEDDPDPSDAEFDADTDSDDESNKFDSTNRSEEIVVVSDGKHCLHRRINSSLVF